MAIHETEHSPQPDFRGGIYSDAFNSAKNRPTEGILPAEHADALPDAVSHVFGDPKWFDEKASAVEQEMLKKHKGGNPTITLNIHVRIWLGELASRRLIWCWNQAETESMAFWHIYGDKGIAIKARQISLKMRSS